jgi:pyruvate-formate lyase-activating enzyme
VGCISLQKDGTFKASHDRLDEPPTPEEVAETALFHINRVDHAVVSFGQGCEGEALLAGDLLFESIRRIREKTDRGTINLNTNASIPSTAERLIDAGLDSMRVSLNSLREDLYNAYYRPGGYAFCDVLRTIEIARKKNIFVSLNLLVFPGVTDTEEELEALESFFDKWGADMVQMRNLNIDPELYIGCLPPGAERQGFGLDTLMMKLREKSQALRFGYFNPPKETFSSGKIA